MRDNSALLLLQAFFLNPYTSVFSFNLYTDEDALTCRLGLQNRVRTDRTIHTMHVKGGEWTNCVQS
jgi:hypothetical protein